jgi:hypothetical protein
VALEPPWAWVSASTARQQIGRAPADDGAQPGAEGAALAGVLEAGQVLDHAEQDLLAEVLQVARRHALAVEPAQDQRTVQVRQVLPGIRFAALGTQQQALPGLVHGPILPPWGRAIRRFFHFFDRPV